MRVLKPMVGEGSLRSRTLFSWSLLNVLPVLGSASYRSRKREDRVFDDFCKGVDGKSLPKKRLLAYQVPLWDRVS